MFRSFRPLVALVALVMVGCGSGSIQKVGGTTRPREYKAVISLSPSTTELFGNMIRYEILRGRTSACNWPPQVKPAPVVAGVKPDYELIAKIKPDMIVYDKDLYSESDVAKIKQICDSIDPHADIWVLDAENVKDFEKEAIQLAAMLGGESNMSSYMDKIYHAEHSAQDFAPKTKPKVAIIMPGQNGDHMICGTDSFQGDITRICGGELVGPKGKLFTSLSAETLSSMNPDFIVTTGNPDSFLKDTRFANLKAVKDNHVIGILGDVVLRRGGRVDVFISSLSNILQGKVHA